jgi:hypothetical protein
MSKATETDQALNLDTVIDDILNSISQEREREIISRRFGLHDDKETLEQVGELLGVTRERVRQLEKAILNRLRIAIRDGKVARVTALEKRIVRELSEMGRVARVAQLSNHLLGRARKLKERARLVFIAELAPQLTIVNENDHYYQAIGVSEYGDEKKIRSNVDLIVETIKAHGEPLTIEQLHELLSFEHPLHVQALAELSKHLAKLKDTWGLESWPTINPKNIRDKVFVVLTESSKPLHFNEISQAIKDSGFKRNNVTTQAIHNELIKDRRFVLIGRGIYALNSWGFSKGTVTDIIADVLRSSDQPLHRDEIVKRVLKSRHVKEATVLLNLQNKPQFKRVAKATYTFNALNVDSHA